MIPPLPLWSALAGLLIVAGLLSHGRMAWTAGLLLANWIGNTVMVEATGNPFNWMATSAIDYASAIAILSYCCSRWQVFIVGLYVVELMAHSSFALSSGGEWPRYRYWWVLHYVAWAQAAVVMWWACVDGGKTLRDRRSHDRGLSSHPQVPVRMGAAAWLRGRIR